MMQRLFCFDLEWWHMSKIVVIIMLIILVGCGIDEKQEIPAGASLDEAAVIIVDNAITDDVYGAVVSDDLVRVDIEMSRGLNGYNITYTESDIKQIICDLRGSGRFGGRRMMVKAMIDLVDQYGNDIDPGEGLVVTLDADVIANLNCDNPGMFDLENVAVQYVVHSLLR